MQIMFQRWKLMLHQLEYKVSRMNGNMQAEQKALENIVVLRTGLRVAKEQSANKLMFH